MGNRAWLYIQGGARSAQVAESNNHFPILWRILLAAGASGTAITDQRVFGDAGTGNLTSDAGAALERLRTLAAFLSRHSRRGEEPWLARQLDGAVQYLGEQVARLTGADACPRFSANLDELSWLSDADDFIATSRDACNTTWRQVQEYMAQGSAHGVRKALHIDRPADWVWGFGFGGLSHAYFSRQQPPREMTYADFMASGGLPASDPCCETAETGDFHSRRRQRFLSEDYFDWLFPLLTDATRHWSENVAPVGSTESERKALAGRYLVSYCYPRFLLMYTGGADIELLRDALESIIAAYEDYTHARRLHEEDDRQPPLRFGDVEDYEIVMQLIGFCYLLHRRDLLPRITGMFDPAYRAQDTLYEDLLAYEFEGRFDVDHWHHDVPYRPLVFSLYRDTKAESVSDIREYLDAWYPGMGAAAWHDGHLEVGAKGNGKKRYFGYWAIEAAAVAYLLELDDSAFRDHVLYPKHLADFARRYDSSAAAPADSH
ncbi:PoNe immunity protein domain-containing protein [Burkholderia sp. F1]|uniref:PoNe immunity protein domain-containing protein n=1 Tax=Burkholderia sp. F1 TaxID=3366817 RepID=UPI003D70A704